MGFSQWFITAALGLMLSGTALAGLFSSQAEDEEALLQQRQAIMLEVNGMAQVYATLFRLEAAAAPLCADDASWLPGFAVASAGYFPSELRAAAIAAAPLRPRGDQGGGLPDGHQCRPLGRGKATLMPVSTYARHAKRMS